MRNSRWLSLRCLYTRGSCMVVGHISVSRERGAPPKNQIECKNRINSSWRVESYVGPVGARSQPLSRSFSLSYTLSFALSLASAASFSWDQPPSLFYSRHLFFSVLLFAVRATRPCSHDSTSKRGRSPPIFPLILLVCRALELCGLPRL